MVPEMKDIVWPGWETVGILGHGSFGAVYEIQRDVLGETEKAALKVISIPRSSNEIREMYQDGYDQESIAESFNKQLKSIVNEYSIMRKFNDSANVVHCDDVRYTQRPDGIGWDIYIKMELLTPLTAALPENITDDLVVKVAKDMCAALDMCQKQGILHRDIKPQNMFFSANGNCKLGDFGIAKTVARTMGGTKIGTYKYMAPEVYNNQPYGVSVDIYSLGLVLYWMLNQRRMPFMPLSPEKASAVMEGECANRRLLGEQLPPPKNGSAELKRIVLKACAYDPKDRYADAGAMLRDLERIAGPIPVGKPAASEAASPDATVRVRRADRSDATVRVRQPVAALVPENMPRQEKKRSSPAILIIAIFMTLLILAGGVAAWLIVGSNQDKADEKLSAEENKTPQRNPSEEPEDPFPGTKEPEIPAEPSAPEATAVPTEPPVSEPSEPPVSEPSEPPVSEPSEPEPTEAEQAVICVFYYNGATTYALKSDLKNPENYLTDEQDVLRLYGEHYVLEEYRNTYGDNLLYGNGALQKEINLFVSNFAEAKFRSYPCSEYSLLSYVLTHNRVNDKSTIYVEDGYYCLDPEEVNSVLTMFFGKTMYPRSYEIYSHPQFSQAAVIYDGEKYCYPLADGESTDYIAVVNYMHKNPDGTYYVSYDVYFAPEGMKSSYYTLNAQAASGHGALTHMYSGEAVVRDYVRVTKQQSYQLISMKAE